MIRNIDRASTNLGAILRGPRSLLTLMGDGHLKRGVRVLSKPFAVKTMANRITAILKTP